MTAFVVAPSFLSTSILKGMRSLRPWHLSIAVALFLPAFAIFSISAPRSAHAAADGYRGWCTGLPPLGSGNGACFPSPGQACQAQFDGWAWTGGVFDGISDT